MLCRKVWTALWSLVFVLSPPVIAQDQGSGTPSECGAAFSKKRIPPDLTFDGNIARYRPPLESDFEVLQQILIDPVTMAHLDFLRYNPDGSLLTVDGVRDRYLTRHQAQVEQRALLLIVEKDGTVVGSCGFSAIDFSNRVGEFGIVLHRSVWGVGISGEAHLLALDYAFDVLELETVIFRTFETNLRMRRFFDRIGIPYRIESEAWKENGREIRVYRYELQRNNWPSVRSHLIRP